MRKILREWGVGALVLVFVLTASGCAALLVGAAVGVGGYAWVEGALVKDLEVPAEKLHRAASRAMRDLKLAVMEDKGDRLSAKIHAKFADGSDATISVAARTERASTLKIRVGLLGDKDKSEMISTAIEKRL